MTPEEFLHERVDDQISWYNKKSQASQRTFKRMRFAEILCAALIPFLAGFAGSSTTVRASVGLLGVAVVILAAVQSLGQFQENWIKYRTACESLKHEKFLFLTECGQYCEEGAFCRFVERVERLISQENSGWSRYMTAGAKASKASTEA